MQVLTDFQTRVEFSTAQPAGYSSSVVEEWWLQFLKAITIVHNGLCLDNSLFRNAFTKQKNYYSAKSVTKVSNSFSINSIKNDMIK